MNENPISVRLNALLESEPASQAAFILIPTEISQMFGQRGRIAVRVTINGHAFRTTLAPYASRHYLGVNKSVRAAAGVQIGDRVDVLIEADAEQRTVTPPDDLTAALEADAIALESWQRLSYSHKREYVDAIEDAKKPETRARRILKTIEALVAKSAS